jgi:exopolyphosphatase/guanosine-5'-triphosphate,3'-diphosphate pyrophosphatase
MADSTVAVIDIGSNSIKSLVAARRAGGALEALHSRTIDARISAGIGRANPALSADGMERGVAAISELLAEADRYSPSSTVLVATSAVREARNRQEFRKRVRAATGREIRVLSGTEEADLIGRGLTQDPALEMLRDFYVFDLGGGSLECLAFRERRLAQGLSLPLGCVRLTERFVPDAAAPFSGASEAAISAHTRDELDRSGFRFDLSEGEAVFTGGSMTAARGIFATEAGLPLAETPAVVTVAALSGLLDRVAPLTLADRRRVPGLPPSRADVFPTALATMIALARHGGLATFRHSFHNLRWGLAAETLA